LNADGYNDGTVTVSLNTFSTAPVMLSAASDTAPVAPSSLVSIYGTGFGSPPNVTAFGKQVVATALKLRELVIIRQLALSPAQ